MSNLSLAEQQQKTKPKIEDVIVELLNGERQQNALDFVAYLREQKLNPRWKSTNSWGIKYKGKWIISIGISPGNSGSWRIGWWHLGFDFINVFSVEHENAEILDRCKEIVWSNIVYCTGCANCKPGTTKTIFGKDFNLLCYGIFDFKDPDADTLECAKKLLECKKKVIAENSK